MIITSSVTDTVKSENSDLLHRMHKTETPVGRPRSFSYSGGNNTTMRLLSSLREHTLSEEELNKPCSVRSQSLSNTSPERKKRSPPLAKKQRRRSAADTHDIINEEDTKSLKKESISGSRTSMTFDPITGQPLEEDEDQPDVFSKDDSSSASSAVFVESDEEKDQGPQDGQVLDRLEADHLPEADQPPVVADTPPCSPTRVVPVEAVSQPSSPLVAPIRTVSTDIGIYVPGVYATLLLHGVDENAEYVVGINHEEKRRHDSSRLSTLSSALLIV